MTRVKICGVTNADNARLAVELGADYLGLNFYEKSPRYVTVREAEAIARAIDRRATVVGVFVNRPLHEVVRLVGDLELDLIQLSGDEQPGDAAGLTSFALKVFRTGGPPTVAQLDAFRDFWGLLLDAPHEKLYGGTGEGWDYARAKAPRLAGRRVFLAGGLGPDNVRKAVELARPFAVDVCSRIESSPGIKDRKLMEKLFEEVRHAEIENRP